MAALSVESLRAKRVLGVPVLYLAAGGAAILAVVAWRMRPAPEPEVSSEDNAPLSTDDGADLFPPATQGTVVAAPSSPSQSPDVANASITDNEEWLRKGVAFLIGRGTAGVDAQRTIQTYLEGGDLSYTQGSQVNALIKEFGVPPIPVLVGRVQARPASVSAPGVAASSAPAPANPAVAPKRTYTVQRGDSLSKIAAKYGTSWQAIYAANRATVRDPNLIYPGQVLVIP